MKSNYDKVLGLLNQVKDGVRSTLAKASPDKLTLSRLSACLFGKKSKKINILKAKYSKQQRQRKTAGSTQVPGIASGQWTRGKALARETSVRFNNWIKGLVSQLRELKVADKLRNLKVSGRARQILDMIKHLPGRVSRPELKVPVQITSLQWFTFVPRIIARAKDLRSHVAFPKFSLSQLPIPEQYRNHLNIKTAVAALAVIVTLGITFGANSSVDAYAVKVDGKTVAVTAQKQEAEKLLVDLKAEKARIWKRRVDVQQVLNFEKIRAKRYQVDNLIALKNKLNKNISFIAVVTGIKVNGQVAVLVKDNRTAADVLDQLKKSYISSDFKGVTVSFTEKVEVADVPVSLKQVLTAEQALKTLKEGRRKKATYTVKQGDSLWTIARSNDMHVEELLKANPAIKDEHLALGQEVNLVALEPMVSVIVTGEQTVKETIPYKVVVENDKSTWRGNQKIKVHGENGARQVTYKVVVKNGVVVNKEVRQEKVLKVAKNQVVLKGSKYVVASRSKGGRIGWPVSGRITSRYGGRWGRMHTGIDIDGSTGQPIGAAAGGVVTSTGWEGAYGKMVTIRHENGLVTRYAHLSKIAVSKGDRVDRGDLIGYMGSTGRSTGSHLHFEVLSGGSFQNPLKFLK